MQGSLLEACRENNADALKHLLTPDNVNDKIYDERTVLEACVILERLECIRYIMEEFKSVIKTSVLVESLACAADITMNLLCIEYLLTHCNRYVINLSDSKSRKPLSYAILRRHQNIIKLLIDHDAKTDGISFVPQWVYDYENCHRERKHKCMALMGVFKRKRAPKDMTKWIIKRMFKFL